MRFRGFTLIEVVIAMFIAAIMFAIGYGAINQALRDRESLNVSQARVTEIQRGMRVVAQDFAQMSDRPSRDITGTGQLMPAVSGDGRNDTLVIFSRNGWSNPAGIQRPAEQRVRYRFVDGSLVREHWLSVDPALNASAQSSALAGFTQAVTHTVSVWHMDETAGTVAHDAAGANNGTLQAVNVNQPGDPSLPPGRSYQFTGSTNKSAMTVPDAPSLNPGTANITVSIHVQFTQLPTPGSGDYDILRKGAATINGQRGTEYKLELLPTGQAYCELRGTIGTVKLTGANNLADGAWHTIICSRTGIGSMSLTVDGATLTANASTSIGSIASSLPFFVGGSLSPVVQDFYRGQIDEVSYASG